jgi:hypothetical protein
MQWTRKQKPLGTYFHHPPSWIFKEWNLHTEYNRKFAKKFQEYNLSSLLLLFSTLA